VWKGEFCKTLEAFGITADASDVAVGYSSVRESGPPALRRGVLALMKALSNT